MLRLIKHVFIALSNFVGFLATKCVSKNDEKCMNRPNLIDLNYYSIMVS